MNAYPALDALLARHSDIQLVEAGTGPALIRRDQLLTTAAHAVIAADTARRWVEGRSERGPASILWLRPGAASDPAALAADLREQGLQVSPNHVLLGQPLYWGGPATAPRPSLPAPPPEPRTPRRTVTVGIIDTGLSPHPWYERTAWYREQAEWIREELDADEDQRLDPQAGHGTFGAGLILRRAPGVRLHVERLLSSDGVTDELALVECLTALPRSVDLLNLSFGGYAAHDRPSPQVAAALRATGAAVVACAGNGGGERPFWPAAHDDVLAVAALDPTETTRADFSNHGSWVGACARGEDLTSSFVTFREFRGFARWSGTSFAAAIVTGAISGLSARADVDVASAAGRLLRAGTRLPGLGTRIPA